jgi:Ca2+-binding EF-hand superfamily protein
MHAQVAQVDATGSGEIDLEDFVFNIIIVIIIIIIIQVAQVDADGSGEIDFDEFLIIMARDKKNADPMDEAMRIFNMFDKDGSGAIDAQGMCVCAHMNICMCACVHIVYIRTQCVFVCVCVCV